MKPTEDFPKDPEFSPGTYTLRQLAALMQRGERELRNQREKLEAAGFPRPLPCFTNLWSRPAVHRWLERNGEPPPPITGDGASMDKSMALLAQRYGDAA